MAVGFIWLPEIRSPNLNDEHRLKMSEIRVPRRIFGRNKEEMGDD